MRGISAKSLDEVLAAVSAAGSGSGDLGTELFDVVATLDREPALRRVLTDPSTEAEAKAGLAERIFGGKVSADVVTVLRVAVSGRWASGRDLTDGLETAGVTALIAAADGKGELDAVETELFEVGRFVRSDAELRQIVSDRGLPSAAKGELLSTLLSGKVSTTTLALASQAAAARTGSFERVLTAFGVIAADRRSRLLAEVRVATELDDSDKTRLAAALAKKYGRDVHLNIVVDPSIVGGISVSLGDEVVDGSMSTRLEVARRRLAG
ncbi:F0F1 ATP synthase subunit delta [Aeromicrobium fastidiosum]|uniref:ATP synthase subunit delta n=1 Tax=Aeromicrobium fastidiosum TaxID=52699 RepID=A0A641AID5_9ACTN|nr:F0F1 ATP synthase subunit delta [Aeromicrobium fastidiosum]KAA1373735.1 F0F1 ATP synthase subunit delta [Aeromicrobium fastidiosum]MBP2391300.1 F-type H+-transporting ATPase subunit delta [Aeromicrobium fastidiosum]